MAQEQFTRLNAQGEARTYIVQFGKDPEGNWLPIKVTPQEPDAFTGLAMDKPFKSLHMEADRNGNVTVTTEFFDDQFTPTGLLSPSFCRVIRHVTRGGEAQGFFEQLRPMLEKPITNAIACGGRYEKDGFLGHNHNRFFLPDGTPNHTPESETALPTFDYHAG